MKIKSVRKIILDKPEKFYDITVEKYHNFCVGNSKIIVHNSSLSQAISKLARPFSCSEQILLGDGFFGTPVNPYPSAPRYTQVKISPKYKEIIEEHKDLNIVNEEGGFDWLHVTYPIGLSNHTVGIAVGYKSNILPRKPEEIVEYLNGDKTKKLKPYFRGFKGKISKIEGLRSSWLIEGEFEADSLSKTINISSLSPLQRYESFVKNLNKVIDRFNFDVKIENKSTNEIKIGMRFRGNDEDFKHFQSIIKKETQQVVTENIVIVKDGSVLEYNSISEYLDEFNIHRQLVLWKRKSKDLVYNEIETTYLEAKVNFLVFMMQKKRIAAEITAFLKGYPKSISSRLEGIQLIKLSQEEIEKTKSEIENLRLRGKEIRKEIELQKSFYDKTKKEWDSSTRVKMRRTSLTEETPTHYNGIQIWNPEEEVIEGKESEELNEEESEVTGNLGV